jgi:hypothetical protein
MSQGPSCSLSQPHTPLSTIPFASLVASRKPSLGSPSTSTFQPMSPLLIPIPLPKPTPAQTVVAMSQLESAYLQTNPMQNLPRLATRKHQASGPSLIRRQLRHMRRQLRHMRRQLRCMRRRFRWYPVTDIVPAGVFLFGLGGVIYRRLGSLLGPVVGNLRRSLLLEQKDTNRHDDNSGRADHDASYGSRWETRALCWRRGCRGRCTR